MATIGIMVEGQEDMTWSRFLKLAEVVEASGFESLFRSDHLRTLEREPLYATLALWPSLTALALRTSRIRFGPLVCPITFRHPSILAKMAVSVAELSDGRLDLGLGAGWHDNEHRMFGIPYPRYGIRLQMLDEAAQIVKGLWSGQPFTLTGKHYQLQAAQNHPIPSQPIPIIMGGKGGKTLQIVAKHADEWNFTYAGITAFSQKSAELDGCCEAIGREPGSLRRSLMIPFVIGRDETAVQARIQACCRMFPSLPTTLADWLAAGYIGGTPSQVEEQLQAFAAAGVQRFMLQHNDLDDLESLELLAGVDIT
jgi:alkanesulfonate monooxygenase SsuD/methylene tetrahydromethanopterin reductase-like flavin-dependent oxidoreductase (luciferase family)